MTATRHNVRALTTGRSGAVPMLRAVLLFAAALLTVACSRDSGRETDTGFEIVKAYGEAPATLTLKVEHGKISVADRLRLVVEATVPESQEVEFPAHSDKLGEFAVADVHSEQPRLIGEGRIVQRRSYVLEPFLAGEYKIPPLTVRYGDKKPDAQRHEITTEEIKIEVASVLPQEEKQPQIKEIAEPVDMPAPWWPWAVGGVALAALIAAAWWWRRRQRLRREAIPPPEPHEVAYQELQKLLAAGLLERGEAKLFYLRLSNILRHYIEDRFGLRAPERTTEEFLAELRQGQPFGPRHKDLLRAFLEHCDLVKFAELQPTRQEAETTIALCRQFIEETKQEELSTIEAAAVA